MSAFQDMVAADNKAVFLNSEEFAEVHDVYYDGTNYAQIPVVLTRIKQSSVAVSSSNRMEGQLQEQHLRFFSVFQLDY